jgi:hypothetical protein
MGAKVSCVAETPVRITRAIHVFVAPSRILPARLRCCFPIIELVQRHLDLPVGEFVAVALWGIVSNFSAPNASMNSDYLAGFSAHADSWEFFVFKMIAFATIPEGFVEAVAERERARVVQARLLLGEEAELGCADHVQLFFLTFGREVCGKF